ncbi:MAG: RNA polymerase sigma factor [Aureispira sp.]
MRNKEFEDLLEQHKGILYKIGRSYTRNKTDFDDLYQEMLIQLWKSMQRFRGNSKLSTWVYRVALNTALTYYRNENRQQNLNLVEEIEWSAISKVKEEETSFDQRQEKIELLYHCIYLLKKEDRGIILLYLNGEKYEEIAQVIGLSIPHIGVKISRIKKQLYKLLKNNNYE